MVKTMIAVVLLITTLAHAQSGKSSLLIQTGYFSSNTDLVTTQSVNSPYIGLGYGYRFNKYFSASVEPGIKVAGFTYDTLRIGKSGTQRRAIYVNIPMIVSVDIGRNNVIVALDAGHNANIRTYNWMGYDHNGNPLCPRYYSEIVFGIRLGYKVSDKVSLEAGYRFGGGLNKFASQNLNSNYLLLQTRINL